MEHALGEMKTQRHSLCQRIIGRRGAQTYYVSVWSHSIPKTLTDLVSEEHPLKENKKINLLCGHCGSCRFASAFQKETASGKQQLISWACRPLAAFV